MKALETERLLLRGWRREDLDDLYEFARYRDAGILQGWKPHENREESREKLDAMISDPENWAIELKELGEPIGTISAAEREWKGDRLDQNGPG